MYEVNNSIDFFLDVWERYQGNFSWISCDSASIRLRVINTWIPKPAPITDISVAPTCSYNRYICSSNLFLLKV